MAAKSELFADEADKTRWRRKAPPQGRGARGTLPREHQGHEPDPRGQRDDNGRTLVKDRGVARFVGEVVIELDHPDDPQDDEVNSFQEEVAVRGPQPILEEGLDPVVACAHLG